MRPRSKRYFTGRPCVRGHISERLASSRACCACSSENAKRKAEKLKENSRIWYAKNIAEIRKKRAVTNAAVMARCYARDPERRRAHSKKWARENPGWISAYVSKRRALKLQAIPRWADMDAIEQIYVARRAAQELFEIPVHVDHIVPLVSKRVCGLHCEANLRLLPGVENQAKSNRAWPDMP